MLYLSMLSALLAVPPTCRVEASPAGDCSVDQHCSLSAGVELIRCDVQPAARGGEYDVTLVLRGPAGGSLKQLQAIHLELARPQGMALICNEGDEVRRAAACILMGTTRLAAADGIHNGRLERTAGARLVGGVRAATEGADFARTFAAERARLERDLDGFRASSRAQGQRLTAEMTRAREDIARRGSQATELAATVASRGFRELRRFFDASLRGKKVPSGDDLADTLGEVFERIDATLQPARAQSEPEAEL